MKGGREGRSELKMQQSRKSQITKMEKEFANGIIFGGTSDYLPHR